MRVANRLIGLLLGLALVAGGMVLTVEIVLARLGRRPWLVDRPAWDAALRDARWDDVAVVVAAAVLVVVGLLLLIAQLSPRTPATYALSEGRIAATLDRRGLAAIARRAALTDGDVVGARARAKRRRVDVRAAVASDTDAAAVRDRVRGSVGDAIGGLGLVSPPRPRVQVRRSGQRAR